MRERDELFDMMLHICGWDYTKITPTARGWVNRSLKDLRTAGLDDPQELLTRARRYWRRYGRRPTPTAIVKHYPALGDVDGQITDADRGPCEHLIEEGSDPPYCVRCCEFLTRPSLRIVEGGA